MFPFHPVDSPLVAFGVGVAVATVMKPFHAFLEFLQPFDFGAAIHNEFSHLFMLHHLRVKKSTDFEIVLDAIQNFRVHESSMWLTEIGGINPMETGSLAA